MIKFKTRLACSALAIFVAFPVLAQGNNLETDCSKPDARTTAECLDLPDLEGPITNFAPVVAPLGAVAAAVGAALGSGASTPTTTSTSTTGTQ